MQTTLSHLQVNVDTANLPFYRDLARLLELESIMDGDGFLGLSCGDGSSVWFIGASNGAANDYDGPGMNHIGFGVGSQADVDTAAQWLADRGVEALFETPRHRPDFSADDESTYYQVMFESPDRILIEVVYIGPRS
jgi:catechol 2,3-dioxygenase-like lactoylglutathione lyase family enzyme